MVDASFITGSMSMLQIAEATGITKEQFIEKWGIADTDYEKPLKDIKDQYGFEIGDIQAWVAEIAPASAGAAAATETETTPATAPDVDVSYIKGSSTMEGISETSGIPKERFIEKWGVSDEDYKKPLKDIKDIYGFAVDDIQTWVAEEIG
ncbi:MAG: hypothetical protein HGA54_02685 [Actinobacteria bacterium]|nr:hypothetical protein [Actinomycetota bacterium]